MLFLNIKFRQICILSVFSLGTWGVDITLFRFDDIRKSGHYSKVNKANRCYPLIFVGAVIAVGSMSNLMFEVLPILFSGRAHSFISCLLLVKDEH